MVYLDSQAGSKEESTLSRQWTSSRSARIWLSPRFSKLVFCQLYSREISCLQLPAPFPRADAERKGQEMAILVADLQRMRGETARNAVSDSNGGNWQEWEGVVMQS